MSITLTIANILATWLLLLTAIWSFRRILDFTRKPNAVHVKAVQLRFARNFMLLMTNQYEVLNKPIQLLAAPNIKLIKLLIRSAIVFIITLSIPIIIAQDIQIQRNKDILLLRAIVTAEADYYEAKGQYTGSVEDLELYGIHASDRELIEDIKESLDIAVLNDGQSYIAVFTSEDTGHTYTVNEKGEYKNF